MKLLRKFFSSVFFCILSFCVFPQMEAHAGAYQTIEAEIPVSCLQVEDENTHVYEIAIESENYISPAPKSDILEITENGTGKFQIDIDEPGTFTYKVYERSGTNPKIKYDRTVYSVSVYVEDTQTDKLTYAVVVTVDDSGRKPDKLEFQNIILGAEEISTTTVTAKTAIFSTNSAVKTTTSAVGTTAVTVATKATTETVSTSVPNSVIRFACAVMTGDTMPMRTIRAIMISAVIIMLITFLFRKRADEEEDENKHDNSI